MLLRRPDKVYWTGSFCKKRHFIYIKTVQKQRKKWAKKPPKKVFFQPLQSAGWVFPQTSWLILGKLEFVPKRADSLKTSQPARLGTNFIFPKMSQLAWGKTQPAGCRGWKWKTPFLEGFAHFLPMFFASGSSLYTWHGYFERKNRT